MTKSLFIGRVFQICLALSPLTLVFGCSKAKHLFSREISPYQIEQEADLTRVETDEVICFSRVAFAQGIWCHWKEAK